MSGSAPQQRLQGTAKPLAVSVVNLGCRVNRVESDTIAASYRSRGACIVPSEQADVVVVNTCTVTAVADKKTRKAVRGVLRANERARVLVTGCAAAIDPGFYEGLDPRVSVVEKSELLDGVEALSAIMRASEGFPARAGVKVQDGCNHACTYCIVHVARGRAWSRPVDEVAMEVRALVSGGVREVVLTGIDLGSYRNEHGGLAPLLRRLLDVAGPARLRLSSVEPRSLDHETLELMAQEKGRICRHLHLPLQSGSSKVLAEMRRPYDAQAFADLVDVAYAMVPELSLTTDVIVGFPGETDQDLNDTLDLVRHARFTKVHGFRYSRRAGTPAAARPDQVDPQVMDDRASRLRALSEGLRLQEARARVGTVERIALERPGVGMSESYYRVEVSGGGHAALTGHAGLAGSEDGEGAEGHACECEATTGFEAEPRLIERRIVGCNEEGVLLA